MKKVGRDREVKRGEMDRDREVLKREMERDREVKKGWREGELLCLCYPQ